MSTSSEACALAIAPTIYSHHTHDSNTHTHTRTPRNIREDKQMTFGQTFCHRVSGNVNNFVIKFKYDYIPVLKVQFGELSMFGACYRHKSYSVIVTARSCISL